MSTHKTVRGIPTGEEGQRFTLDDLRCWLDECEREGVPSKSIPKVHISVTRKIREIEVEVSKPHD